MKLAKLKILILLIGYFCLLNPVSVHAYNQDALNYNDTGVNYTKKGNYEQAITYFKKAIETDPSLTNAYYNLGSVYKYTGSKDKAIKSFQMLLRNNPDDDEVSYILASLYYDKTDYEKALIYLNSIEKGSSSYKDSIELFKKINQKINDSVISEPSKPANYIHTQQLTFLNFEGPTGIAEDSNGNLYVANYSSDSIRVCYQDGKQKNIIKNDLIKGPVGIAIDSKDNIYVANYPLNNVVKIDKNGAVKVVLKDVVKPYYLYFNKAGVLFVSEQEKNTVIRIGIPQ